MIKTDIKVKLTYNMSDIRDALRASLPIEDFEIRDIRILKRSLAVTENEAFYKMTVALSLSQDRERGLLKMRKKVFHYEEDVFCAPHVSGGNSAVVVGSGPAGLFAALTLAESGIKTTVIERGECVEERRKRVDTFTSLGILDPESNIQFGEGGAGTYSDGKLKVGSMDRYKRKILSDFVRAGADEEILYSTSAHLGTDKLSEIIKKIREKIISLGGEFIFSARLVDMSFDNDAISSVTYEKDGGRVTLSTDNLVLAIGHSARDTFEMLLSKGFLMQPKGFGIGLRIEHPREYINSIAYGKHKDNISETASYHLVSHLKSGRSVYSFCMCPGGTVVAATSEAGGIVTNGMSVYSRDGDNSNSALLVSLTPDDFGSESPLSGFDIQRNIERRAYGISSSYKAPATSLDSITSDKAVLSSEVTASYPLGVTPAPVSSYMPSFVAESIAEAMPDFDAWLPGFNYPKALLTGPETRSTSPVRILRSEKYEVIGKSGVYPVGEGAGYAGGIVSSALDGMKGAEAIINKYL